MLVVGESAKSRVSNVGTQIFFGIPYNVNGFHLVLRNMREQLAAVASFKNLEGPAVGPSCGLLN